MIVLVPALPMPPPTAREVARLAATSSPEEVVSTLRRWYDAKKPLRHVFIIALCNRVIIKSKNRDRQLKAVEQWLDAGLHNVLLDIALDQETYPDRSRSLDGLGREVLQDLTTAEVR